MTTALNNEISSRAIFLNLRYTPVTRKPEKIFAEILIVDKARPEKQCRSIG